MMNGLLASPLRNLTAGILYMLVVSSIATFAYTLNGWSLSDAFYMVVMTVFTVGYGEVRPIVGSELRAITIGLMLFGCTGMIFLTGALVQLITVSQFQSLLGNRRMQRTIDELSGHTIICGFGRIGQFLARELHAAHVPFVVLERNEARLRTGRDLGFLCLEADATDEAALTLAGVTRAKALATVLPDDAANVFITLSARGMHKELVIIARGESPSTETKLLRAGANRVVLPAHIGAERIAEILLFRDITALIEGPHENRHVARDLQRLGLNMEVMPVVDQSPVCGQTIEAIEKLAEGAFMVVALHRAGGGTLLQPGGDTVVRPGDGLAMLGRPGRAEAVQALFAQVAKS